MIQMLFQYPFKGGENIETCPFGKEGSWACGWHIGVDLVCRGDKTIYPIAEGVVDSINAHGKAYGNHVTVKHPNGMTSLYAHMESVSVKKGQTVTKDTKLGIMGATGNVKGAHLHLELHRGAYHYPKKGETNTNILSPVAWIEYSMKEEGIMEPRTIKMRVKGSEVSVEAINYEGSNYIKLRDIPKIVAEASKCTVGWDAANQKVIIE